MELKDHIRTIPDFPIEGVNFIDITTLLKEPAAFREAVDELVAAFQDDEIHHVVAAEARGFILGGALAYKLDAGFIPIRKPGKLPARTVEQTYELEYGSDTLCMHRDAIEPGDKVLVLDDLLATGGTVNACCELVEGLGGVIVACAFMVELSFLNGRSRLKDRRIVSLVQYESE